MLQGSSDERFGNLDAVGEDVFKNSASSRLHVFTQSEASSPKPDDVADDVGKYFFDFSKVTHPNHLPL